MKRHRDNIVMVKLGTPRKETLPDGRAFYAKYIRVNINSLLDNARIRRTYKRRNNNQRGRGLNDVLNKGFNLAKRVAKSRLEKILQN